jgi:hypothetical protein
MPIHGIGANAAKAALNHRAPHQQQEGRTEASSGRPTGHRVPIRNAARKTKNANVLNIR